MQSQGSVPDWMKQTGPRSTKSGSRVPITSQGQVLITDLRRWSPGSDLHVVPLGFDNLHGRRCGGGTARHISQEVHLIMVTTTSPSSGSRDGRAIAGVQHESPAEKLRIAKQLKRLGVDVMKPQFTVALPAKPDQGSQQSQDSAGAAGSSYWPERNRTWMRVGHAAWSSRGPAARASASLPPETAIHHGGQRACT